MLKSPDAVRRMIVSSPDSGLSAFADAFRLRTIDWAAVFPAPVYLLCFLTSAPARCCLRELSAHARALLLWSALCFVLLAANNFVVILDLCSAGYRFQADAVAARAGRRSSCCSVSSGTWRNRMLIISCPAPSTMGFCLAGLFFLRFWKRTRRPVHCLRLRFLAARPDPGPAHFHQHSGRGAQLALPAPPGGLRVILAAVWRKNAGAGTLTSVRPPKFDLEFDLADWLDPMQDRGLDNPRRCGCEIVVEKGRRGSQTS